MATVPAPRPSSSDARRILAFTLAVLLASCHREEPSATARVKVLSATASEAPVAPEEELVPELLVTEPIDSPEPILAEESEVSESLGDPKFASIGVSGGAGGGMFGGRRGGKRNLKMMGGASVEAAPFLQPGAVVEADARHDTESYDSIVENPFHRVVEAPLSTFSVDVDTASYSLVRRFLGEGRLPPRGAVRIEEMVNYFRYAGEAPSEGEPFAVRLDAAAAPWAPEHRLVRVALKGRAFDAATRPAANLVFLVDVSGSMDEPNKLPLVKSALKMLAARMDARDRIALVVYAGSSGLVLPSTSGTRSADVSEALDRLDAGGSTNGGQGIELAYRIAGENLVPGGINRVILATDGDFNVGVTNRSDLVDLIEKKAKTGVFLTALGFGMGNVKDSTLEQLADKGNGNYAYVDSLREAGKVLVEEMGGTLQTIAKDVKIQVEFNPARVAAYRLLGYENRVLAARDFNDDRKDAGEIGAGHCVTALYEVVPAGIEPPGPAVDPLKYQEPARTSAAGDGSGELLTVKVRWKEPEGSESRLLWVALREEGGAFEQAPPDFRFAAAVAGFGMLLRESENRGAATYASIGEIARGAVGDDPGGYRAEFLTLVDRAAALKR